MYILDVIIAFFKSFGIFSNFLEPDKYFLGGSGDVSIEFDAGEIIFFNPFY